MSIRTRFRIINVFLLCLVGVIAAVTLLDLAKAREGMAKMNINSEIARSSFYLRGFADEYLTTGEDRPKMQWQKEYNYLGKILKHGEKKGVSHSDGAVKRTYAQIANLFKQLVEIEKTPATQEIRDRLKGMLTANLEILVTETNRIHFSSEAALAGNHARLDILLFAFVILIALLMAANLFLTGKSVIAPIIRLTEGVKSVGDGNFAEINIKTDDEFGQLAQAFNNMSNRLKKSYEQLQLEVEEKRRAEERLIRSNRELEQFAYVASHDLKEPVRNIAGSVQLLKMKYIEKLGDEAKQLIDYSVDSAKRLEHLIDDLLDYCRVQIKPVHIMEIDCNVIMQKVISDFKNIIDEKNALISFESLPILRADEVQLSRILQNLISNALKFSDQSPKIHVSAQKDDKEWIFSVQDNGIGIDPENIERIFQMFRRVHSSNDYPGTGIGLSVAKKIVEQNGGRIWAISDPGMQTAFYFSIPISEESLAEKSAAGRNGNADQP